MALSCPKFTLSKTLTFPHSKTIIPPKTHLTFTPSKPNLPFLLLLLKKPPKPLKPLQINSLFTGIVEEMGEIKKLGFAPDGDGDGGGGFHITIAASTVLADVHLGDSIAVNGTCLTVTEFTPNTFTVNLAPETLRRTNLSDLKPNSLVNLERALLPSTRLGGHFVQGHVDAVGEIVEKRVEGDSLWVKVRVSDGDLMRFLVPKGYVCVDGTSLTVVNVYDEEDSFDFMLVAYTQQKVVVASKGVGENLNLEVDVLGKYVERILQRGGGGVTSQLSSAL